MEGPEGSWKPDSSQAGIIPRAVSHIFSVLEQSGTENQVRVSHLEVYNEELFDLLKPSEQRTSLRLFDDRGRGVTVQNLEEVPVKSPEDVMNLLERSSENRRVAGTDMNAKSSRSHAIFTITVVMKETKGSEDLVKVAKLNLVDLAGSENVGRSGAIGERAAEARKINRSLLTLGRVINSLVESRPHVPYRESKLTRLLQESLGGRTKTCIVATISPSSCSLDETMSTLDYMHRAKNIKNTPEINARRTKRALIKEYGQEISRLKLLLQGQRAKDGVFLPEELYSSLEGRAKRAEELDAVQAQLNARVTELEGVQEVLGHREIEIAELKDQASSLNAELLNEREERRLDQLELKEARRAGVAMEKTASELIRELNGRLTSVRALFSRIESGREIDAKNQDRVADLKEQVQERTDAALQTTEGAARQLFATLAQAQASLEDAVEALPVVETTAQSVRVLARRVSARGDELKDAAAAVVAEADVSREGVSEALASKLGDLLVAAQSVGSDSSILSAGVEEFVASHQTTLKALKLSATAGIGGAAQSSQDMSSLLRGCFSDVHQAVESYASDQQARYAKLQAEFVAYKKQNAERIELAKHCIRDAVEQSMDGVFTQQSSDLDCFLTVTDETVNTMSGACTSMRDAVVGADPSSKQGSLLVSLNQMVDSHSERVVSHSLSLDNAVESLNTLATGTTTSLSQSSQSISSILDELRLTIDISSRQQKQKLESLHTLSNKLVSDTHFDVTVSMDTTAEALVGFKSNSVDLMEDIKLRLTDIGELTRQLSEEHNTAMQDLNARADEVRLSQALPNTGNTPLHAPRLGTPAVVHRPFPQVRSREELASGAFTVVGGSETSIGIGSLATTPRRRTIPVISSPLTVNTSPGPASKPRRPLLNPLNPN
eukprot:gnl/Dysnectes_brevis/3802_a4888_690.p1 GENE.gnl/Dysnectes_brevis/3802_a4888_690~~gnl/Dysnectes_brevis/3802_a4888_690.p1  ORF type:complete len:1005 (-),score=212.12 gnl/Dysnectes_brevis/3802_a4888_690:83-2770(-)